MFFIFVFISRAGGLRVVYVFLGIVSRFYGLIHWWQMSGQESLTFQIKNVLFGLFKKYKVKVKLNFIVWLCGNFITAPKSRNFNTKLIYFWSK